MKNKKVVSLFSGAGGLDYGFAKAGFEIVFANDFNRFACETYRHNFSKIFDHDCNYLVEGDINKLFDSIPANPDVLIGGAPCQSWSLMGNRAGAADPRGQLLFKQVDVLINKKPRLFIWENVKGLLSHDSGSSFELLLSMVASAGYRTHFRLFNMSEYGIPQRRERVLIFGTPIEETIDLYKCIPEKSSSRAQVLSQLLASLDAIPTASTNHNIDFATKPKDLFGSILRPGENLRDLSDADIALRFSNKGIKNPPPRIKGRRPVYRLSPNEIAPTMVFNNGTNIPWHPWKDRPLSVREAAMIQTFPLTFEFKGKLQEQYKQVANAVPPKFSELLANTVLKQLNKETV